MTILFLSRLFYPHIGGVEKHVLEVSKRLVENGHKVNVVTEEVADSGQARMTDNIEIYRIPVGKDNWFKKFKIWAWLFKHRNLIKNADIVHAHDVFFWYLPFRFLYPKKPVYTTFHGYEGNKLPSKKAIFMHKLAERLSFGNICVGDFLKKWYGTKPTFVTYGGVDVHNYHATVHGNNTRSKTIQIVYVGRLEEEAGIMEYLKAVKILKDKGYKIKIDVLGDGSLRKASESFCLKNKLNARFRGFIENVNQFLFSSDFVFTSRYLGILEAFANKKLVFALYNNEIKEDYLKMTPFAKFMIIGGDEKVLFQKFDFVLSNPIVTTEVIDRVYEWVKNKSWKRLCNLYCQLWKVKEQ